ncbi:MULTISPECIES: hypothetical protein [Comamonas]|uniref:hypothetical protein n=1 Tax=Comamonas TaxID=283 RepID=UPI000A74B6E4|nr:MULTISPECIES: hypothetical protein [Comamonas]
MKYSSQKELNQLIRQLVRQGWSYRQGRKHGRLTHPDGWPTMTVAKSPSDSRSVENFRHDLRKAASLSPPRLQSGVYANAQQLL